MIRLTTILLLIINVSAARGNAGTQQLFNQGISASAHGNYAAAIQKFQYLLGTGVKTAGVYCNLGNAYFKCGESAKAMLAYEQGLLLSPFDQNLIHNRDLLAAKLKLQPDNYNSIPGIDETRLVENADRILLGSAVICFVGALCLVLSFITVFENFSNKLKWAYKYLLLIGAPVLMLCLGLLIVVGSANYGIIHQTVFAKAGPAYQSKNTLQFKEGEKVLILNNFNGWYKLKKYNGAKAWVPAASLTEVVN